MTRKSKSYRNSGGISKTGKKPAASSIAPLSIVNGNGRLAPLLRRVKNGGITRRFVVILSSVYENDCNRVLKNVQHDAYPRSLGSIFKAARSELTRADAVLETHLLIVEKIREVDTFDHRVLQDAHDIIAAAFRYQHDDGAQLTLFENPDGQGIRYLRKWVYWLDEQLKELVKYPKFVRSVVQCVVFSNTEMGYMAEHQVGNILLTHFSAGDWMFQGGCPEVYQPVRLTSQSSGRGTSAAELSVMRQK